LAQPAEQVVLVVPVVQVKSVVPAAQPALVALVAQLMAQVLPVIIAALSKI
jgi:hypothetical protein